MNVRPWCWCWGRLTRLSVVFFFLGVVVKYPFLISQSDTKNLFSVVFESAVHKWKITFQRLSISVHKALNFLIFESFPWLSIVQKRLVKLPPMILQASLTFDSDLLRVMPLILYFRIFLAIQSEACFQRWNLHSWNVETILYMIYQLEQCHHKLWQVFDGLQPHFSSN